MTAHPSRFLTTGFTLIEMMIVISLMVMLLMTATSLFFTSLLGSSKTNVSTQVKEEGTFAISQMEFLLRNAITLAPNEDDITCAGADTAMTSIALLSYDNGITELGAVLDSSDNHLKIASNSSFLTSNRVELPVAEVRNPPPNPAFYCSSSPDGTSYHVEVVFTLRKGTPGVNEAREIVEETFRSGVTVRTAY